MNHLLASTSPSNLRARWKLTNGSPNDEAAADKTGSAAQHNLTEVGSPADVYDAFSVAVQDTMTTDGNFTVTQGKLEGLALSSLDFESGSSQYVTTNNSAASGIGTGNWTTSMWLTRESIGAAVSMLGKIAAGGWGNGFVLGFLANNKIRFDMGARYLDSSATITTTNKWYHITCAKNTDEFKIWIDGVLDSTGATSDPTSQSTTQATPVVIGRYGDYGPQEYYDGKLRDIRIYDYLLSDNQVASLYSGSYNVTPLNWWKLDEGHTTAALSNGTTAWEDSGTGTDYDGDGVNFVDASGVNGLSLIHI